MRVLLVPVSLLLTAAVALACGDKLMLIMRATSSQVRSHHPAVILAYPGQNASAALIRNLQLQPAVRKAGHRFQVVENPAGLDNALKASNYDLVLADVANASEVREHVSAAPFKPVVLPVAFKASKEEQSAAQKKYHCLLKAPIDPENYLAAIDQALDWKLKTVSR
jgi:CheY-like chemotaxis protein